MSNFKSSIFYIILEMSTKDELIKNLLNRLYPDESGTLKIKDNSFSSCLFCDKKTKEAIKLRLQYNSNEHEFLVNFCKKHLKIFNEDEYHYTLPES